MDTAGHADIEYFDNADYYHELYFDKSLRYELVNFRAQQNTRDIMQDLADTAAGIEVVHQADAERLKKEHKQARIAQRVRALVRLMLTGDLDHLTYSQKNRLKKHLSDERIAELMEQRAAAEEQLQTTLFV